MTTFDPGLATALSAALYGRSNYEGKFLLAVAEIRDPVRVVHMRRSGNVVLLAIADGNHVNCWRVTSPDDPRLQVLGCDHRGQAQGLLIAIQREVAA